MDGATPEYVGANAAWWDARDADQLALATRTWFADEPTWGIFSVPESEVAMFPSDVSGLDAVELGCGTAYVSAWLARAGARPVAVDPALNQLRIARRFQDETGIRFPLVRAVGEQVPLRDGCADLVVSEYGAAIWADPHRWVPEAARLLRPGGQLAFLGNSTLLVLCVDEDETVPATDRLLREQFGIHRFDWDDTGTTEFHLSHGDWIRVLTSSGLEVTDLVELRPPPDASTDYGFVTADWARRWPAEEVWKARKRG